MRLLFLVLTILWVLPSCRNSKIEEKITQQYGQSFNSEREKIGLEQLPENWFFVPDRGMNVCSWENPQSDSLKKLGIAHFSYKTIHFNPSTFIAKNESDHYYLIERVACPNDPDRDSGMALATHRYNFDDGAEYLIPSCIPEWDTLNVEYKVLKHKEGIHLVMDAINAQKE